jgi:hypothetical protein
MFKFFDKFDHKFHIKYIFVIKMTTLGGADFLVFQVRNGTMRKEHAQNIHVACNQSTLN